MLMACTNPGANTYRFEGDCWQISDTLDQEIELGDVPAANIAVRVHLLEEYAYRNLWIKLEAISPSGKRMDTMLNRQFVDANGYWEVKRKAGKYPVNYSWEMPEPEKGTYRYRLIHYMREDALCGIYSASLTSEDLPATP